MNGLAAYGTEAAALLSELPFASPGLDLPWERGPHSHDVSGPLRLLGSPPGERS
jgi:hypothetical protein